MIEYIFASRHDIIGIMSVLCVLVFLLLSHTIELRHCAARAHYRLECTYGTSAVSIGYNQTNSIFAVIDTHKKFVVCNKGPFRLQKESH